MNIKLVSPFLARKYPITQGFGENPGSYVKFGLSGHNGIDYGCPTGSLIYSSSDGTVTKTGFDPEGYGNFVRVSTTWGRVIYAHLSEVCCSTGQFVRSGDFIGRSGNTGNSTGPHLHFEVRLNGHEANGYSGAVDPTPYFDGVDAITPSEDEPKIISSSKTIKVIVDVLNLRCEPNITADVVGALYAGAIVQYTSKMDVGDITWLQLFDYVWCAYSYVGETYVTEVSG